MRRIEVEMRRDSLRYGIRIKMSQVIERVNVIENIVFSLIPYVLNYSSLRHFASRDQAILKSILAKRQGAGQGMCPRRVDHSSLPHCGL